MISDENLSALSEALANQCRDFLAAFDAAKSDLCHPGSGTGTSASERVETGNLEAWAVREGKVIPPESFEHLPLVSNSTSEHEVRIRDESYAYARAIKRTWAGVYGQIPVPLHGKLDRANATPAQYLYRMALHVAVFGSDLQFEGVSRSDAVSMIIGQPAGQLSLIISQPWHLKRGSVSLIDIRTLMEGEGFREIHGSYFGWYRQEDRVAVVDAKPDNFIATSEGIIPLDLQMAQFTVEQEASAGLIATCEASLIVRP